MFRGAFLFETQITKRDSHGDVIAKRGERQGNLIVTVLKVNCDISNNVVKDLSCMDEY